jgi:hypothetical protein
MHTQAHSNIIRDVKRREYKSYRKRMEKLGIPTLTNCLKSCHQGLAETITYTCQQAPNSNSNRPKQQWDGEQD